MRKLIIFIIVLLTLISCGDAYKNVSYSGYVYDAETNEPIEGLVVDIHAEKDTRSVTDVEGYFHAKMNVDCVYETYISAGGFIYATENFTLGHTTCDNQKVKHDFYLEHRKSDSPTFIGTVYENGTSNTIDGAIVYLSNSEIVGAPNEVTTNEYGAFEELKDYIDYVTDLYIHAEKGGYHSQVKISVDDWGPPGVDIYLEVAP
jgi:hypothetical protein